MRQGSCRNLSEKGPHILNRPGQRLTIRKSLSILYDIKGKRFKKNLNFLRDGGV
jgi:hypothetical protein